MNNSTNTTSVRRRLMQMVANDKAATDYYDAADLLSEHFGTDSHMVDEIDRLRRLSDELLEDYEYQRQELIDELQVLPAVIDQMLATEPTR